MAHENGLCYIKFQVLDYSPDVDGGEYTVRYLYIDDEDVAMPDTYEYWPERDVERSELAAPSRARHGHGTKFSYDPGHRRDRATGRRRELHSTPVEL